MGNCDIALERISASLDGALTIEEQSALDAHLAECAACSALYTELHGLHTAAAKLEELPAPTGFTAAVMAAIAANSAQDKPDNVIPFAAKRKTRAPWTRWAASAAAVAIVVLGAVSIPSLSGNMEAARDSAAPAEPMVPQVCQEECSIADAESDIYYGFHSTTGADDIATTIFETPEKAEDSSDCRLNEPCAPAEPVTKQENEPLGDTAPRCGTLTLPANLAPEGLEQYEGVVDADGAVTYTVPADYFFSALQALEHSARTDYQFVGGDIEAQYGIIVISGTP